MHSTVGGSPIPAAGATARATPDAAPCPASGPAPCPIQGEPAAVGSKQMALYERLRDDIVSGALGPDRKLPSTRELSQAHGIARGTAVVVYELLESEGYIVKRRGAGTFVAPAPPGGPARRGGAGTAGATGAVSRQGRRLAAAAQGAEEGRALPFAPSGPALGDFPVELWARLTARHARLLRPFRLAERHSLGVPRLREAIADRLSRLRGVDCAADQVFLTSGLRQSMLLCVTLLTDPGDEVALEDPGCPQAAAAVRALGREVAAAPVDAEGMRVPEGPRPRLACVTPAYQNPTGVVMTPARRQALLDWAARTGAWVLEDDRHGEFRYGLRPVPPLWAEGGPVLHAGDFADTLFPALNLGYLVVPARLVEPFSRALPVLGHRPSAAPQLVLADFIESGHLDRHVARLVERCRERREALVEALAARLGGAVSVSAEAGGLALPVWWGDGLDAARIPGAARAAGLSLSPMLDYEMVHPAKPGAPLGFAAHEVPALRAAAARLAEAVDRCALPDARSDGRSRDPAPFVSARRWPLPVRG